MDQPAERVRNQYSGSGDAGGTDLYDEVESDMVAIETKPSADARADDYNHPSDAAETNKGEDVRADRASEDVPRVEGITERDKCTHQGQEIARSFPHSSPEAEPAAEIQETSEAAEAASHAETTSESPVDHSGWLAREVEDVAAKDIERTGGAHEDGSIVPGGRTVQPTASTRKKEWRRTPQYRGPSGSPPPRRASQFQARQQRAGRSAARTAAAEIAVRVLFERGGHCSVSLLPKRLPGLPDELVVSSDGDSVELLAMQDQWYQDVVPDNLDEILLKGIVWKEPNTGQEWLLSGRKLFVLTHRTTHRGFVSCPRLSIGRRHLVLCTVSLIDLVEDALRTAGCAQWSELSEHDGVPPGWRMLRDVIPQKPVHLSDKANILNILRPLPEIEIALEGGIRLAYNSWLLGYPPVVHIFGDPEHKETVLIDDQKAAISDKDGYTAPGWDIEGDHQISCSGISKIYSLVRTQGNWTYWPAHSFAISSSRGDNQEFAFCGPLVRPVATDGENDQRRQAGRCPRHESRFSWEPVPARSIFYARGQRSTGHSALDYPLSIRLWALPSEPLRCDKNTNRVLFVGESAPEDSDTSLEPGVRSDVKRWCLLILDAGRKRLLIEPANPSTDDLWQKHKTIARSLWRKLR